MAKTLAKAALVVGAVALAATGVGAAVSAGIIAASGVTATIATVASIATLASIGLSIATALTAKKPSSQATGSPTTFSADPDAGIPLIIGRTGTAGDIVFRRGWDTKDAGDNDRQVFVSVLSLGPVAEVEPTLGVDRTPVNFDAQGRAIGTFRDWMWRTVQVGLLSSAALGFGTGAGAAPGWTAQHGISGKAATAWTLRFDTKAKFFQNGVPAPMNVVKGQFCYDPRKDSTYPGGSGPHRMADPADRAAYDAAVATWEYSECPYLNGLRYVHGYWQRDMANPTSDWQRVMGMGAPLAGVDLASFVEGANVSDANGWKAGGVIYSGDDKWASLKKILQAGMGEPLALGAKVSCLVNAPKVSLATVTIDDVVSDASVGATQPRRDRVNTITPRFRLEANNWQLLPGAPISVAQHVIDDRGKRSRVQDYPLIQDTSQVGTAVRYDIENAREFGPIVLPCKLFWMGYKPGDCLTAELPELGLVAQPILLLNRGLNPSSGTVTLTARSETPGKHPFALGQTATPPPTPGVSGAPIVPVPGVDAWALSGGSVQADGVTLAALTVTGAVAASAVDGVIFDYRPFGSGQSDEAGWIAAGTEAVDVTRKVITGVRDLSPYEVSIRYSARGFTSGRRILGPVDTGAATVSWGDGVIGPNKPADNATNSADPTSPFGPGGTVGDVQRAIDAAKARQDTLENETIPAVNRAVKDAGDRITAARQDAANAVADANIRIDGAVRDFAAEVDRAQGVDEALTRRIDAIVAEGGYDDTDVRALISSEATVRADDDRALGRRVDTVSASIKNGDDAVRADVKVTTDALARADAAFAEQARVIEAGLGTVDNRIAAKAQEVTTAYADADRALGRRIDSIVAEGGYDDTAVYAAVDRVDRAAVGRDVAIGERIDTVKAGVDTVDNRIAAKATEITRAYTDKDQALNERMNVMVSEYNGIGTSTNTRITQEVTALSAADVAATNRMDVMVSEYNGIGRDANARITQNFTTLSDADRAATSRMDVMVSEYNGIGATVTQQAGTLATVGGKTAAYVRIIADAGNGRAALSLWSDQYGGAWSLTGDGLIDGNLTINGTLKAKAFDRNSMSRYAQSVWTGSLTPSRGSRVLVPWSLGLSTIAAVGRFIYEFVAVVQTNDGQRITSTYNGKPYYIDYVPDTGGLEVICLDPQGNGYRPRANGSDPVLATADFAPLFQASIGNGSYDSGIIDDGDYYMRQIAATYTVTRIDLRLTWVAV